MKKFLFSLLLFASFFAQGQKLQDFPSYTPSSLTGIYGIGFFETSPGSGVWLPARKLLYTDILNPYVKKSDSSVYYTSRFAFQHWKDSVNAAIAAIPSLANYYTKTQADARYLQSFSETDPKRIVSVLVTGTSTKTVTITLADATTVTTTFTDQQGAGGGVANNNPDSLGSHPAAYYAPLTSVTKTQVGLPNVDNTSDVNKPVSSATQTALANKADIVSPVFSGTPKISTDTIATKAYARSVSMGGTATDYQYLNATDYSIFTTNSAAQNTASLNALIVAAKAAGKGVKLSPGIFLADSVTIDPYVRIIGAGRDITKLRSTLAVPLFKYIDNVTVVDVGLILRDMTLDGNDIGTIGMNLQGVANYSWQRLLIRNFTQTGIVMSGVLMGEFNDGGIIFCPVGVRGSRAILSGIGVMQPNLCLFTNVKFQYLSTNAVEWSQGAGVFFNNCNWEQCGTNGNSNSGCILGTNMSPSGEGVAFVVSGGWAEINHGGYFMKVSNPASDTRSIIRDILVQFGNATNGVYVDGSGSFKNEVFISGATFSNNTADDLFATGAKALIQTEATTYTSKTAAASATIRHLEDLFTGVTDPMAAYTLYDDFNRTPSTSSLGNAQKPVAAWVPESGTWGISANKAYCVSQVGTGSAVFERVIAPDVGKSDYTYQADFNATGTGGFGFEMVFRYTDANNHWIVEASAGSTLSLYKKVAGGSYTQVGSTATYPYVSGQVFNLKIVTSGNDIEVLVDNVSKITVTDAFNNTATKVGIAIVSTAGYTNPLVFDNVKLQ